MIHLALPQLPRIALLACLLLPHQPAHAEHAPDLTSTEVRAFVDRMASEHGVSSEKTLSILAESRVQPRIIEIMQKPAEKVVPWYEYREIFLKDKRIAAGVDFWNEHAETLDRVSKETGVAEEIIVGIIGVETFFGQITGNYRVIDSLVTLAFEYPPRSKFFTRELEQFLLLVNEQDIDVLSVKGSYAGAMGGPQFISSSYRAYAVDGSGDRRVDLWSSWPDIIASVANYFAVHGWQDNGPVMSPANGDVPAESVSKGLKLDRQVGVLLDGGVDFEPQDALDAKAMLFSLQYADGSRYWVGYNNFYVITRYNRSVKYATAVYQLGVEIDKRKNGASDAG